MRRIDRLGHAVPWLVALGYFCWSSADLNFATQIMIWILFALSLDLALGYAGILTLGHSAFFGLGGALGAQILSLEPSYALKYIVLFLVVVIVGGEGSFEGSFVASIALGIIDTLGKYLAPEAAPYLLYAAVFALLLWRPKGLLPPKSVA